MKTITVDGEEYIQKSVYDNAMKYWEDSKLNLVAVQSDPSHTIGIGLVRAEKGYVATKINLGLLEQVIASYKAFLGKTHYKDETVILAWAPNYPVVVGKKNEKGEAKETEIVGFVIAPRVDNE